MKPLNSFLKILCSIPVILIALYFSRFLGIVLVLFRLYVYRKKYLINLPVSMIMVGALLLIPSLLNNFVKIDIINKIVTNEYYIKAIGLGRFLIIFGIICFILYYIFSTAINNASTKLKEYINKEEEKSYQIEKENNLIMKEKQEKAKNTHFIKCPSCGADNTIVGDIGTCKYCRKTITYENKNI